MNTNQAARKINISHRQLGHWIKMGVIKNNSGRKGVSRSISDQEVKYLNLASEMRKSGLSISNIKDTINSFPKEGIHKEPFIFLDGGIEGDQKTAYGCYWNGEIWEVVAGGADLLRLFKKTNALNTAIVILAPRHDPAVQIFKNNT